MQKRFLSLLCVLALCLGLLPVTALAEGTAPDNLYVGDQRLPVGQNSCWTTDANTGKLTEYTTGGDEWTVKYDPSTATLTLKNATIIGVPDNVNTVGAGIYAASSSGPVSLNIVLVGENKVTGVYGINVSSEGAASLSITGSGSLTVSATADNGIGIFVQAQSDANLTIDGANVNAVVTETNGRGVELSTGQAGNPNLTIEVQGGSLQASGQPNGIKFFTNANNTRAVANLKVSGNAMVKTSGITTDADGSGSQGAVLTTEAGSGKIGGIVFDGSAGTVYGTVELQNDLTISEGETLTIGDGASLTVPSSKTLTNNGTVTTTEGGILTNNGTINNSGTLTGTISGNQPPKITTTSLPNGEVDTTYNQTLGATDSETITWSLASGSTMPAGLTLNSDGTITGTPTTAGQFTFTATATNSAGSDSKEYELTINAPQNIPVNGVTLNPTLLSLFTGGSETLTATVEPSNATNKNVTWSSDKPEVATVENGKVTAKAAGTATITVTTEDGGKTATCAVTVTAATVPVTGVTLNKTSTSLYVGGSETLTATVAPEGATNKNVTWSTSDASVATVENGVVRATGRGTATITVTTEDGGFTAGCTVTVSRYSTGGGSTTYAVTAPDAENGTVRVSPSRASRGTTVTITVTPDEGYELESLTVLDSRDNEITLTDKGDGKYTFTMPSGRVTVEASFAEIAPEPLPFDDVDDGDWFADAVRFVYENGMMNGVSETDFAPHAATSRSMIVTILYRLEGEPVVDDAMDFTDVAGDAYYAEAVRWAASEGIVGGYGGGLFGADDAVTREQLAAILYRYAVYKGYDVSIGEDTNILSYADFADLSEYAIPAMQWACGAGVITGVTDATLVPQGEATRAQVAAMLMRFVEAIG